MIDVVLPCLDESKALPWVLGRMPAGFRPIVVDNRSTDESADIALSLGARVIIEPRRGFGAACHAGLRAATSEVVCICVCDATLDPSQLPRVARPILTGEWDLMLGRRRIVSGGAWPVHSLLAKQELVRRVRRRTGLYLRDLGPMRAARREALLDLRLGNQRSAYPVEMVVRAAEEGWLIGEIPVDYLPPRGRSGMGGTLRDTLRAVREMSGGLAR